MERSIILHRLGRTLRELARRKAAEEARRAGWPLPAELAVHLWLKGLGFGSSPSGG